MDDLLLALEMKSGNLMTQFGYIDFEDVLCCWQQAKVTTKVLTEVPTTGDVGKYKKIFMSDSMSKITYVQDFMLVTNLGIYQNKF